MCHVIVFIYECFSKLLSRLLYGFPVFLCLHSGVKSAAIKEEDTARRQTIRKQLYIFTTTYMFVDPLADQCRNVYVFPLLQNVVQQWWHFGLYLLSCCCCFQQLPQEMSLLWWSFSCRCCCLLLLLLICHMRSPEIQKEMEMGIY